MIRPQATRLLAVCVLLIAIAAGAYFIGHHGGKTDAGGPLSVRIAPTTRGNDFAEGAIGLSVETKQLAAHGPLTSDSHLIRLMRRLGPGVLRIGGNSVDYSRWTSVDEPAPAWATSIVTPADLVRLRRLLDATNWKVILGLDLGHFDPGRAADEARFGVRILGTRLAGFEIGNEPNNYSNSNIGLRPVSYGPNAYLNELDAYRAALRRVAPTVPLLGPDLASASAQSWWPTISSSESFPFSVITQHYYPTTYSVASRVCRGTPAPTATSLLSPRVREAETTVLGELSAIGGSLHRPTWISETNSTSSCDMGGGPQTSPVFASALWSLDWVLRSAAAGIAGIDFHGNLGKCPRFTFSPICATTTGGADRGYVTARPEYYGLLAARRLEGGRFVAVDVSPSAVGRRVTAYATLHLDGTITLAVDNFSHSTIRRIHIEAPDYQAQTCEYLIAPSIHAVHHTSFGDMTLGTSATGVAMHTPQKSAAKQHPTTCKLPAAGAVVITLYRAVHHGQANSTP